ncbi:acyltransferase [Elizabethkingia ursingii]|uniref:acyltransferase family protein n=1 Tax=Elizabethkingia ursingii TaxID=1756150 RepID=UPI00201356BA|nr:acyltransferase [Elizabethkingia ursingii]MCL1665345.1 acyltransferase [Elizabethkingia ursingii]
MDEKKTLNHLQSEVIELLRFPLIVLVVFVHMLPFEQKPLNLNLDGENIYNTITELISHYLGRLPVPCFFLFSGYFFFFKISKLNTEIYFSQLKKRIKTLLIPYISWNIIYILLVYLKNIVSYMLDKNFDEIYMGIKDLSLYNIFWGLPINYPLWYVRDLIVMTIAAPLFYYLFKYTKFYGLLIILAIYLSTIEFNIPGLGTTAIFYFGLGAFMGLYKKNMLSIVISYRKISMLLAVIALGFVGYYNASEYEEYWVRIFLIFGIVVLLFGGYKCLTHEKLKKVFILLAPTVFFIYGSHMIYILGWLKGALLKSPLSISNLGMLIGYFIIPFICICIILIIYRFMEKYCPKVLSFITGNRRIHI